MLPDQRSQRTLWYVSLLSLSCHFTSLLMKRYNSKPSLICSKKHANVQSLKNLSQRKQQFSVLAEPVAAVLNGDTGSTINNMLVKDQPILLDLFCQSNFLARLMAIKEIGCCNVNVMLFLLGVIQLIQNILFHGLIIQLLQRCLV